MNKRENSYDWLRLLSCIMVIFIHASSSLKENLIMDGVYVGTKATETMMILAYNVLPRFSVSCFFLISGAFLLNNPKNRDLPSFYKKIFAKTLLPSLFFYLFYFLFMEADAFIHILIDCYPVKLLFDYFIDFLSGAPSKHLWTMTILLVLYLFVPILILIKERMGEKRFNKIAFIYFVIALLSAHSSYYTFYWSFGMVFDYLGFFLLGSVLKNHVQKKNKHHALLGFLCGITALLISLFVQYRHTLAGIQEYDEAFQLIDPYSPLIAYASIMIFYAFANVEIRISIHPLSKHCFIIYLAHAGIIKLIELFNTKFVFLPLNPIIHIPVTVIITFFLSLFLSIIFDYLYHFLDGRFFIKEKLFSKLKPLIDKIEAFNRSIFQY